MVGADMVCSNEACARESEAVVASVEKLDVLVCDDCDCLLTTLSTWQAIEVRPGLAAGTVVGLPAGRTQRSATHLAA